MTLGQKLKKLRIENNLTQKDLSDQLHVSFQTVSKWENDTNEPDFSTLKELAKIFNCSIEYLFSDEEYSSKKEDKEEEHTEESKQEVEAIVTSEALKQLLQEKKELHVCPHCNKEIPEEELKVVNAVSKRRVHGRGAHQYDEVRSTYYYHKKCYEEMDRNRKAQEEARAKAKARKARIRSWTLSGVIGGVVLGVLLGVLLGVPKLRDAVGIGGAIGISIASAYSIFAGIYCVSTGSYIGDVFLKVSSWSIRFPGVIFSLDFGGIAFLIAVKILFAILGFMFGVFVLGLAISLSAALAAVSFPFVLVHNINNNYADAL